MTLDLANQLQTLQDAYDRLSDDYRRLYNLSGSEAVRVLNDELTALPALSGYDTSTLDMFQSWTRRTQGERKNSGPAHALMVWSLGIAGEAGEVADYVKKVAGHGHPLDRDKLIKELGDVLWYVAAIADLLRVPLSIVALENQRKLAKRYPDGPNAEASMARADEHG